MGFVNMLAIGSGVPDGMYSASLGLGPLLVVGVIVAVAAAALARDTIVHTLALRARNSVRQLRPSQPAYGAAR